MTAPGDGGAPLEASALCERVLEAVGSGVEAEVTVRQGLSGLTRFANSHIHQNVAEEAMVTRLKVCVDGRQAAVTSTVAAGDPRSLVQRALAAARLRPVDPDWPGVAAPAPPPAVEHYDGGTATAEPHERAAVVKAFVGADPASRAAGFCRTSGSSVAFANTAGQRVTGRTTEATVEGIHRIGLSDGRGWHSSASLTELDGAAAGRSAAAKASGGVDAVDLEPGRYEVVLEPACVSDLLDFLAWYGFNAKAHAEGQSFVDLGREQIDPLVSIVDDAADGRTTGLGFDAEGTPKARLELVREGVCVGVAHDRRTARRAGGDTESTGHAVAGGEGFGALCTNLFLLPGTTSPAEMVASVDRGLLVTELWYTRILDPKSQVVTGLTRNGLFLVEAGEVRGAVRNLRFTQSYVEALAPGNVLGVGDDARLTVAGSVAPSVHLASWNFTGGAQG